MDWLRQRVARAGDERGAVLVLFAIWLPVLVLLMAFVLDVANWFEHRRHLQMQADAAALAAAADWAHPGCDDARIEARAREYGGWGYNAQIGGTPADNVHLVMNSRTYHGQTAPVDDTVDTRPPCQAGMVDVKLTETDLPWFFDVAKLVPFINAHARVSILQADTIAGALPVGVPDSRPQKAAVTFVDESTGEVLGTRELERSGQSGGFAFWDNAGDPLPLTVDRSKIGVRIALGGGNSVTCGEPLVDCYDTASSSGITRIRGWTGGSLTVADNPAARDVRLVAGTCGGAYFSALEVPCAVGIEARIDFGTATPAVVGATVKANVGGNKDYTLAYDATSGLWRSNAEIPVPAGVGAVHVDLQWEKTIGTSDGLTCSNKGTNPCKGTFADVHSIFAGSKARSGPIVSARVYGPADPLVDVNSVEACSAVQANCTHDLVVELKLVGSLEDAQSVNDPPVALRVVGGSQNQSLDCDPALSKLKDEIAEGCEPTYTKNAGTACPPGNTELWNLPEPWPCVGVQTGTAVNQVAAGMNLRVLGAEATDVCSSPNNWASYPNLPRGDPRIVQVFLTPFGSFSGSGNTTFPVTGFATFYVTGWSAQGSGFANPCEGQGDDPVPNGDGGYIMGHFIKYVSTLNNGSGTEPCDLGVFGTCIAVMSE